MHKNICILIQNDMMRNLDGAPRQSTIMASRISASCKKYLAPLMVEHIKDEVQAFL
jgi:hypothetical protein